MLSENELKTKEIWSREVVKGRLYYPNENVVRFLVKNKMENGNLMDYGCGAGRHCFAAAKMGYNVYGVDYNLSCLELAEEIEAEEKEKYHFSKIHWVNNKDENWNILDVKFDRVVAWGSLFYQNKNKVIFTMKKINEMMTKGGLIYSDWRNKEDYLYFSKKEKMDEDFYKIKEHSPYVDILYYFADINTLKEIYETSGFNIISIEDYKFSYENRTKLNSWYHVLAEKI